MWSHGFEPIRVAELADVPPGDDQGCLDGVLGDIGVPKDAGGNRHASVSGGPGERVERITVPLLCAVDECGLHVTLTIVRAGRIVQSGSRRGSRMTTVVSRDLRAA